MTCDGSGSARASAYTFDFADGTTLTGSSPTQVHTYDTAGSYTITLTVQSSTGQISKPDQFTIAIP